MQVVPEGPTVLANEQVIDGRCERCGTLVERARARAVVLQDHRLRRPAARRPRRCSSLAGARDDDAAQLDRPLRGRGGRSSAARSSETRLPRLHDPARHALRRHLLRARARAPRRRAARRRHRRTSRGARLRRRGAPRVGRRARAPRTAQKTGVPLGRTVTNPVNGEQIPMFVADYVLMEYGTGAMMAVPAHDERDYEFARKFGLAIRRVVAPAATTCRGRAVRRHTGDERWSTAAASTGMRQPRGDTRAIVAWLEAEGSGEPAVNYRLRDWLLSRQRYWGCPIPIVYCDECGMVAGARGPAPGRAARGRGLRAEGQEPARRGRGLGRTRRARSAAARRAARPTRWTPSSTPPGTSCATSTRTTTSAAVRPRDRRLLDAGRPVHRRRRARDPAPDVRALLHQGARGHGGCSASRSRSRASSPRG